MFSFTIIFLAFVIYSALHSMLASLRAREWARRIFGEEVTARYYRLGFNLIGVVTLLPVATLVRWLPDRDLYVIPFPWRWLPLAGQALALLMLALTLRQTNALDFLGLRQLAAGSKAKPGGLVTDGFYRTMRHPLYTGSMLFLWLTPVMTMNLLAFYLGITAYFVIGAMFEERKLERYFGDEYSSYKARTGMFLPKLVK